jgi:glycosyltransferase involved in cell wall biosynthesis
MERYIQELGEFLESQGHESRVLWLVGPVPVPAPNDPKLHILSTVASRFEQPSANFRLAVQDLLTAFAPDLVHFHTFGQAEAVCARFLRERNVPYFYTYHCPSCSCRRHDLLLWNRIPCDGRIIPRRCLACKIHERGRLPVPLARLAALLAVGLARRLAPARALHSIGTEMELYAASFREFLGQARNIIVHADWAKSLLISNGAREPSIVRLDMGVSPGFLAHTSRPRTVPTGDFVVGYIGRLDPQKGPQIVVEAFRRTPYERARLWVVGGENSQSGRFESRLRALAAGDQRIKFCGTVAYPEMPGIYSRLSLLVVPSVWYETGPFVVREALALGIPVITSATMGDLRLLRDAGARILRENSVAAWQEALGQCFERHRTGSSAPGPLPVRIPSTAEMFQDVLAQYERSFNQSKR